MCLASCEPTASPRHTAHTQVWKPVLELCTKALGQEKVQHLADLWPL
jgi:hypothetical protein